MSNHLAIKKYEEYKFFFVETTADCNLRCKYCYYKKVDKVPEYTPNDLVLSLSKFDKVVICFLGGEPFLNPKFMEDVITSPELLKKKVVFAANTNGTCLGNLRHDLLRSFSFYHLSVDGAQENHDYYRGKGNYQKVLSNIKYLRRHSDAGIIARMTVSNPDQINDIPRLRDNFDAIYWQINNSPEELPENFVVKYIKSLRGLFEFWENEVFLNKFFTIIPFVGMCDLILNGGMDNPDIICGAGTNHVNICVDKSIYPCPESPHRLSDSEKLGMIDCFEFKTYPKKLRCTNCDILRYCGGRCAMTDDNLYCEGIREIFKLLTSFLGHLDRNQLERLREIVDFQKGLAYTTEIIP